MTLRKGTSNGRTYLSIVHGYREKGTGKVKSKVVQSLGYLEDLEKQYDDPISHFQAVALQMTIEAKNNRKLTITIDLDEELEPNTDGRKNLGYAAILKIYHRLQLQRFLNNKARHENFEYNTNSIMTMLIISRLLSPGSKSKAYSEKERYFERFDFSEHDMYRSLSHFAVISKDMQRHINDQITAYYGQRNTRIVYYDVTNYYFEIDKEDELRKRGFSKENKRNPIVQLGLAMDADGIPLHYELFPGNIPDKSTFRSVIGEVRRNYDTGRIIVVADMGIITGDNIHYLVGGEKRAKALNGYVMSYSIPSSTAKFKSYVLDMEGYRSADTKHIDDTTSYIIKSRMDAREINVTMNNGKIRKRTVYEKQVVFWSQKYADKAKTEREKVILKAKSMVAEPSKYTQSTTYGAAKYVMNIEYDESTGEVITNGKSLLLDVEKILEEEKFDGYYAIVTSELEMSDEEIIEKYRGLWEIEESFRITKNEIEARPVFVSQRERIEAHFLTCFIALVVIRLLQKHTDRKYSCEKIIDCLNRISCSDEDTNMYLFDYRSNISDDISDALGIDFRKKRLTLAEVKSIVAESKS